MLNKAAKNGEKSSSLTGSQKANNVKFNVDAVDQDSSTGKNFAAGKGSDSECSPLLEPLDAKQAASAIEQNERGKVQGLGKSEIEKKKKLKPGVQNRNRS